MPNRTISYFVGGVIFAIAILTIGFTWFLNTCEDDWCFLFEFQRVRSVRSFEECAARGYAIMESSPRQCATPDGQSFTEIPLSSSAETVNANVVVTDPVPNAEVTSPLTIRGRARVFENVFNYRLRDADGKVLVSGHSMANAPDVGMFGPFEVTLEFTKPKGTTGTLEVYSLSAKDGSEMNVVRMPVVFGVFSS